MIRTDGSIWTYNAIDGLTKITESTSSEEFEEVEYIKPNAQINVKKVGEKDAITGIEIGTTAEEFYRQNNFNSDFQAKLYDKNNNEIAGDTLITTGTIVKLYKEGKLVQEYAIVLYGDTTGDGILTAVDALALIKHINKKILFTSDTYLEAGRVMSNSGDSVTTTDALAIVKAANKKFTINQNK